MSGKKILVTGGCGDLGQRLVPSLVARGDRVYCLDPHPRAIQGATTIAGSVLDRATVRDAVVSSDIVIHIAAWHGFHAFTQSRTSEEFWDLNMTGTFNLLEGCASAGIDKFIFISSSSVDEWPEMYGMTKVLGEELCRAYAARCLMRTLCLRPRAFIPWWNTAVYESFEEWASWFAQGAIHIDDVARAVLLACDVLRAQSSPVFEIVDLDGKRELSDDDLARWEREGGRRVLMDRFPAAAAILGKASWIPKHRPRYKDISKAASVLKYKPLYGLAELLEDCAKFQAN